MNLKPKIQLLSKREAPLIRTSTLCLAVLLLVGACSRTIDTPQDTTAEGTVVDPGSATVAPVSGCPYEARLAHWKPVEDGTNKLLITGVAMPIEHITVCRNGSAVYVRRPDQPERFAVRFIRANQNGFKAVLLDEFTIEERVSFPAGAEQPTITADPDGRVTIEWQDRSQEIVGERRLYLPSP